MSAPPFKGSEPGADRAGRLAWAMVVLAGDIEACEALGLGHAVPRARLNPKALAALGEPPEGPDLALDDDLALRLALRLPNPGSDGAEPEQLAPAPPLQIVAWENFVGKDEPSARPLLGSEEENVLPADGLLVCYGDGGAGKTSWSVDAFVHLAAGLAWQGHEVARPLRILVIENEGPRGPFRRKLREKEAAWDGPPFRHNIFILEEPWARVTFADAGLRAGLASFASEHEIDLLGAGPVSSLGFKGGGTLEEVAAFAELLTLLRAELLRAEPPRPLAAWLVHHENKAGDISGAWEGRPDTLVHLRKDGRDRSVCHWQKTRWAPSVHGRSEVLRWLDGERYEVVDGGGQADEEQRAAARAECRAWIVRRAEEQHAADGSSIAKEATAEAYHQAHDGKGRNLARGVFEELLAAWDAHSGGEESGEEEPLLARGPGDRQGGKYLIPARHAPSPLAATPSGDRGDEGLQPPEEAPPRHLAACPKDGEEAWRGGSGGGEELPGEGTRDSAVEQAERLLERHADLAGEGGPP